MDKGKYTKNVVLFILNGCLMTTMLATLSPQDDQVFNHAKRVIKAKLKPWTPQEDLALHILVKRYSHRIWTQWAQIAKFLPGRTGNQCSHRWTNYLDPTIKYGVWSEEENEILKQKREELGNQWARIATFLGSRIGKQCREHWLNYLNPDRKTTPWAPEEDQILIEQQQQIGNKWAQIAKFLSGRTDNDVKNRWNNTIKRRQKNEQKYGVPVLKRGRKNFKLNKQSSFSQKMSSIESQPQNNANEFQSTLSFNLIDELFSLDNL